MVQVNRLLPHCRSNGTLHIQRSLCPTLRQTVSGRASSATQGPPQLQSIYKVPLSPAAAQGQARCGMMGTGLADGRRRLALEGAMTDWILLLWLCSESSTYWCTLVLICNAIFCCSSTLLQVINRKGRPTTSYEGYNTFIPLTCIL
jgi:hypothetical protein